eukprot:SAG31_NODE_44640_length_262_cov_0.625767_1_plen_30_part_01
MPSPIATPCLLPLQACELLFLVATAMMASW